MTDDLLNIITGLTESERKSIFRWLATLTDQQRMDIVQKGVKISFELKDRQTGLSGKDQKYAALIMAARKAGWDTTKGKGYRIATEPQYEDFSHLREAKVAGHIRKGRKPKVRKQVFAYWGVVEELHANGHGFRAISAYLKNEKKLKVSSSYLCLLWEEVNSTNGNDTV